MKDKNYCNSSPDKQHHKDKTCRCSIIALEPSEKCPIRGGAYLENRCAYCGKFMKVNK